MLKQQHQLFTSILVFMDSVVVVVACYAAWLFRLSTLGEPLPRLPGNWEATVRDSVSLFAVPIVVGAFWFVGLYRPRRDKSLWGEYGTVVKASVMAMALLVVGLWLLRIRIIGAAPTSIPEGGIIGVTPDPGRVQLLALAVVLPALLCLHRTVFRWALRQLRKRGYNLRHVAVVGIGRLGQVACRTIERNSWTGLNVAYFISAAERSDRQSCLKHPVKGGLADLERTLEKNPVDAVYLAVPSARAQRLPELLKRVKRLESKIAILESERDQ